MSSSIDWPELPDWGVYLHWPSAGIDWIHPDDVALAESLIPSQRVFHRVSFDGVFYRLEYGEQAIRVKPSLWLEVKDVAFRIGDSVEILGMNLEREPKLATIQEIHFDPEIQQTSYILKHRDMPLDRTYQPHELRMLSPRFELKEPLPDLVIPVPEE